MSTFSPVSRSSDALKDVPEPVLFAVEKLARQPRVTVPDVAAAAGVDIPAAENALVTLANVTGAAIDVTDGGELAYRFPRNVRQVLTQKSIRAALRMAWEKAFPFLFTAVRIGFGAFLLISIVLTFLLIAALSASARSSDDRDDSYRRDGGGTIFFGGPRVFGPNIFDIMFYSRRYGPYGSNRYAYDRGMEPDQRKNSGPAMSFLASVYSFVFGDGDPNKDLMTSKRWRKIAAVIRANNGAVVAEQIAPFLDLPKGYQPQSPLSTSDSVVDEGYMLPVLQRFHGHPEVTDDGDLVYVFPDFGLTGSSRGTGASLDLAGPAASAAIREKELQLSEATDGQKLLAGGLGILNLGGALTLGSLLSSTIPSTADSAALLSFAKGLYPGLLLYALTFVFVPIARYFWQRRANREIRERNRGRESAAVALARPNGDLRRKLMAAARRAQTERVVSGDSVIYSSDLPSDQPSIQRQISNDFDRRLREIDEQRY